MVEESRPLQGALQAVLDAAPNAILLVGLDGRIAAANRALARLFSLEPGDAVNLTLDQIFDRIAALAEDPERFRAIVARIRAQEDLAIGLPFSLPDFTFRAGGADLHLHGRLIQDQGGATIGQIWTIADISEIRRSQELLEQANLEIRRTQAKLVQSEKMASLGMLVAGIAHEINTPIGAVRSMHDTLVKAIEKLRAQLESELGDAFTQNAKIAQTLKIIEDSNRVISDGSSRVTNIVRRLRSFARLDEAELKQADVNEGIVDTLTLIQHELKHGITVVRDFGRIPPICCYPGRLNQVFLNMLMNARQAIPERGEIKIATRLDGDVVRVSIKDSGVGITQENLQRIFDPGFTTKGVGVGTGLGLSICHQIVEEHKGRITVESEVGQGTTFTVEIPANLEKTDPDEDPAE